MRGTQSFQFDVKLGRWDHPRGCGEHPTPIDRSWMSEGSSPRMRGTLHIAPRRIPLPGIIPADAGNTRYMASSSRLFMDHPRGCGEHLNRELTVYATEGSSPRMRGTLLHPPPGLAAMRIIPADAGNTSRFPRSFRRSWDHPRGCGEHQGEWPTSVQHGGSSPRMRGTRFRSASFFSAVRIIPADAGNTCRVPPPLMFDG